MKRKLTVLGSLILEFAIYLFACDNASSFNTSEKEPPTANSFVGNESCQSCHAKEWNDWKVSDHFKAMLPATDSTVKGDFNNVVFTANGVSSRFFKKGSEFYINTQGPDGKNQDFKVLYTFGHYPLQQYLVQFPGGRMQVTRLSWDSKNNKWFNQYEGEIIHHTDWLHWTKDAQNWNTMCAGCHSTNLQKNYNIEQDSFHTTYSSVNVGCESCHGAGKRHIEYINKQYKSGNKVAGHYIKLNDSQKGQLASCSPCHSVKSDISSSVVASEELFDNHILELPTTERFYADGQIREEDFTWASFLQSKMMHLGVTCNNCHNSHTGRLIISSNQLCLQCHSKTYDSPSHHFHQMNTVQAECKSCHMPGKFYMGNDYRHDHSFRVPRADLSALYGVPNACTSCHKDKSNKWAADATNRLWGSTRKYHFSEDLIPGSKLDNRSEEHLTKLVRDTATPAIIKATSLYYLSNILTNQSLETILQQLSSSDAFVRYYALRSLSNFPTENWRQNVAPFLKDKVRAVRIAAADLFTGMPADQIPEEYATAFKKASGELRDYLFYQADFASGNMMIGDYLLKSNDITNAQKFYLRALKKDSLLNLARLNLSVTYNMSGNNAEALRLLKTAAKITPKNDRIFYNLGLLNIEMKDTVEAMRNFDIAVKLKSQNPRVYYNYGVLLHTKKNAEKGNAVLEKGLQISPYDQDLQNAIRYYQRP